MINRGNGLLSSAAPARSRGRAGEAILATGRVDDATVDAAIRYLEAPGALRCRPD
ncbi:hypothetical protein ACIA8E_24020 [Streptomyces sp. NPDC051664]|uniref:hypothetical protein n=1 Tax=Streptomyces sp. NPDC051664 TaxID=3365668 RepID=UPI00379B8CE1